MLSFHLSINVIIIVVSFKILDLCPIALFQQLWNTLYIFLSGWFHDFTLTLIFLVEINSKWKIYQFGKIYAVYYSIGKKKNFQPFANIPIFAPSVHEKFCKMNLHPEGLIFGYFWLQKWIPRSKKNLAGFFLRFCFGDRKEISRDRLEEFERPSSIDVISGHYILRDCWRNLRDRFGPSKHLKKTLKPGTNFHAFSFPSIHVATNFLKSEGKSPSSGQNFTSQ